MPKPIRRPRRAKSRPSRPTRSPAARAASKPASAPELPKSALSRNDTAAFKAILLKKRGDMVGDVEQLEGEAFRKNRQDAAGDLSTMPIHMADLGTDNFEQDITLNLIESEEEELREIDNALERIKRGVFGRCERCKKMIAKSRLKVLPTARLCIECKKDQEGE